MDDITTVVAKVTSMPHDERVARQKKLDAQMAAMLAEEESQSVDCEVCGFKFKTPALRIMHIKQWHAEVVQATTAGVAPNTAGVLVVSLVLFFFTGSFGRQIA